jgi:hypothetical protein
MQSNSYPKAELMSRYTRYRQMVRFFMVAEDDTSTLIR